MADAEHDMKELIQLAAKERFVLQCYFLPFLTDEAQDNGEITCSVNSVLLCPGGMGLEGVGSR